jgi:hypothetical protein
VVTNVAVVSALEDFAGWDAGEDRAPQTHDTLEGGAPIRVHGETLVVLEHEEASGTGGGREIDHVTTSIGVKEYKGWVGTNRESPIP